MRIDFLVGDAQALPVPSGAFDVVTSVFGVMFAPDQPRAAAELLRVCRPGGTIALASWMPEGFAADVFAEVAARVPPPPGLDPPMRWGTEAGLAELLGGGAREIATHRRTFDQHYLSPDHAVALMRAHLGPIAVAFAAVGAEGEEACGRRSPA